MDKKLNIQTSSGNSYQKGLQKVNRCNSMRRLQNLNEKLIGLEKNMELDMKRNGSRENRLQHYDSKDMDLRRFLLCKKQYKLINYLLF